MSRQIGVCSASIRSGLRVMSVSLLVLLLCSCAVSRGPSSALAATKLKSECRGLEHTILLMGAVPLSEALRELIRLEAMRAGNYPPLPLSETGERVLRVPPLCRGLDLVSLIEVETGWVWCGDGFIEAPATHPMESPDDFGRPSTDRLPLGMRPQLRFQVRAFRVGAGVNFNSLDINAQSVFSSIDYRVPDGVKIDVGSQSERIYYEPYVFTQGSQPVVQQKRQTASAGFTFSGLASRLPNFAFRCSGVLSLSAFTGEDSAKVSVSIPCEIDAKRGEWQTFYVSKTTDLNLRLALLYGLGVKASATAEQVVFQVRVDD